MFIFLTCWFYVVLGFGWIYAYYVIYDVKINNSLGTFLLIMCWPVSFLYSIPTIYKLIKEKLNI